MIFTDMQLVLILLEDPPGKCSRASMKAALLFPLLVLGAALQAGAQPVTVPIYVNENDYSPNRYTIYAGLGGGPILPYLFDTGAPNMFTVVGAQGGTPTGNFTFATETTYNYFLNPVPVTLGTSSGTPIVSSITANVAAVVSITQNGTTTPTQGTMLPDGTYGDFGAGLYGTSTLGTILAQIPLSAGLLPGWSVNVAGLASGNGTLTLGLTPEAIQTAKNTPGAIIMPMSPSGDQIPTFSGLISGYNKAQVASTTVRLENGSDVVEQTLPTVFDTGGGPNVVIYDTAFLPAANGNVTISYNGTQFVQYDGTTPFGGRVIVDSNLTGGLRVNPGGAAIYQNFEVLFALDPNGSQGELILVPAAVPEPSSFVLILAALGCVGFIHRFRPLTGTRLTPEDRTREASSNRTA